MNNKRFLKSILATSALAAALAPHAALGAATANIPATRDLQTGAGYTDNQDSIKLTGNNVVLTPGGGAVTLKGLEINDQTGATLNVDANNVTLGPVVAGADATKVLTVTISDNKTLTLNGTTRLNAGAPAADTYTGLGNITINGAAGKLIVNSTANADTVLAGNIIAGGNDQGLIELNTGNTKTTTFKGTVGADGTAIKQITLAADTLVLFEDNVFATKITAGDNVNTLITIGGATAKTIKTTDAAGIDFAGAGKIAVAGNKKAIIDGHVTLDSGATNAAANSGIVVNGGAELTMKGNILGAATSRSTVGNGATLTFDSTAARTVASDISGAAADNGTLVFAGKADVTSLGANASLGEVKVTGTAVANRLKLTGAMDTKKLTIGAAGIETAETVTIGADGSNGTGKLTITGTGKALKLNGGDYAATGDVHLNAGAGNKALTVESQGTKDFDALITTENVNTDTLTFKATAATARTFSKDIGTSAKKWANVNLDANGAASNFILSGAKVYTNGAVDVTSTNNASTITFTGASGIVGKLKASNAGVATIALDGDGTAATVDAVDTALPVFGNFNVLATAKNSHLTVKATDADRVLTLTNVSFAQTEADDSGLKVDLGALTGNNAYTLTLGGAAAGNGVTQNGAHGGIHFIDAKTDTVIGLTLAGRQVGTDKNSHLNVVDATGKKVKLTGAGLALHTKDFKASEVELSNVTLGLYNSDASAQVGKFVVDGANGTIAADSVLKDGSEAHFKQAGSTLTLGDNVAFNGTLTSDAAGSQGILALNAAAGGNGGNTILLSAAGDSAKKIAKIQFNANANKTSSLEFTVSDKQFVDVIEMNRAGTLNFNGNLSGAFTRTATGTGKLVLQGGSVTGALGTTNAAGAIETLVVDGNFTAGDTAASNFAANNIEFNSKNATLTLGKNVTVDVLGVVTTDTANTGNFVFSQNVATGGDIGKTRAIKSITMKENKGLTVTAGDELHVTNIYTDVNNSNTVTFANASDATGTTIGTSSMRFATVTNTLGNAVLEGVHSTDMAITAGQVTAKTFDVTNAITGAGIAVVADGGSITKTGGTVEVQTAGSATLNGDIAGKLAMNGAAGKVVTSNAATITGAVTQLASTLKLNKTVTMSGGYTGTGSTIDFGSNQIKVAAGQTFAMLGSQNFTIDGSTNPIVADTITLNAATDVINITIDGLTAPDLVFAKKTDGTFAAVTIAGNDATSANFKATGNDFFKEGVTYDATTGKTSFAYETDVDKVTSKAMRDNDNQRRFIARIVEVISGNKLSASDSMNEWGRAYRKLSAAQKDEIVAQIADNNQHTHAASSNAHALDMSRDVLQGREVAVFAGRAEGVAAGDAADKFGLWAKGTFGTATQKLRKGESGYKSNAYGAYVGIDTMLNDRASVGLMAGFANDRMKLKDSKAGGKTKANSWMFGAYGSYDFGNDFFAQANAALAQTSVKTREPRLGQTATGKYDVMGYAAEVRGGYKFRFDNSAITPSAGLRFNYLGDTSYTETGAGINNKKIAGKSKTGIDAVAGVRLSTVLDVDGMVVHPEVHMNVDYALSNTAGKVDYNLEGSNVKFNYKGAKPAKFGYNFGASVMTQNDNMEYGVGYDARISDKYLGHQGSVKVKLNF